MLVLVLVLELFPYLLPVQTERRRKEEKRVLKRNEATK
jgi:hypothetical protein